MIKVTANTVQELNYLPQKCQAEPNTSSTGQLQSSFHDFFPYYHAGKLFR